MNNKKIDKQTQELLIRLVKRLVDLKVEVKKEISDNEFLFEVYAKLEPEMKNDDVSLSLIYNELKSFKSEFNEFKLEMNEFKSKVLSCPTIQKEISNLNSKK